MAAGQRLWETNRISPLRGVARRGWQRDGKFRSVVQQRHRGLAPAECGSEANRPAAATTHSGWGAVLLYSRAFAPSEAYLLTRPGMELPHPSAGMPGGDGSSESPRNCSERGSETQRVASANAILGSVQVAGRCLLPQAKSHNEDLAARPIRVGPDPKQVLAVEGLSGDFASLGGG